VKFYKRYDSGGHFASIEKPEVLVSDIREFFGAVAFDQEVKIVNSG
jgi:hypothetical protein